MGGIITHEASRAIEQALALQPRCRYLADFLAQTPGPVSLWELVDRITPGSDDDGPVRTYICRIRAALGPDSQQGDTPRKPRKPRPNQPAYLACTGKEPFSSAVLAASVAKRRTVSKKSRGKLERVLSSYHCDHCGFFHIGGLGRR